MNLKIENGILENIIYVQKGRMFRIKYNNNIYNAIIIFDEEEAEQLAKKFEEEIVASGNKTINLVSDENRLLVLKNEYGTLIFAKGYIDEKINVAYDNFGYLMEQYGITPTECLSNVTMQLSSGKLKLSK